MPKKIDYLNKKVGRLKFIEFIRGEKKNYWRCICDCGREVTHRADRIAMFLKKGSKFECTGCKFERLWPDLTNKIFGRLTVLKEVASHDGHHRFWLCRCECGTEKEICGCHLTRLRRATKSCGCYMRKIHSKWANTTRYPPAHDFRTAHASEEKKSIYACRSSMVAKCYNKKNAHYKNFGAKGVIVCDLWRNGVKDFYQWCKISGFKKNFGLFLKPGAKEFGPENCFWAEKKKQTGIKNSKLITYKGETKNITNWAKELNISTSAMSERLKRNSVGKALTLFNENQF